MSRYSPTVLPRTAPGGDPVEEIVRAIGTYQQTRRQQKHDRFLEEDRSEAKIDRDEARGERKTLRGRRETTWAREDEEWEDGREDRSRSSAREDVADHDAGIRRGAAPTLVADAIGQVGNRMQEPSSSVPLPFGAKPNGSAQIGRAMQQSRNVVPLGGDRHLDLSQTPQARAQARQDSERRAFVDAFSQAGGPERAGDLVSRRPELADEYLFPKPQEWKPQSKQDVLDIEEHRARVRGKYSPLSQRQQRTPPPITIKDATDRIIELYTTRDEFGEEAGVSITPQEVSNLASEWMRTGRLPESAPATSRPTEETPAQGQGFLSKVADFFGQFSYADVGKGRQPASTAPGGDPNANRPRSASGSARPSPTPAPVDSSAESDSSELDELAASLTGPEWTMVPDRDLREALQEEGLEEVEIDYVLRARKRR